MRTCCSGCAARLVQQGSWLDPQPTTSSVKQNLVSAKTTGRAQRVRDQPWWQSGPGSDAHTPYDFTPATPPTSGSIFTTAHLNQQYLPRPSRKINIGVQVGHHRL